MNKEETLILHSEDNDFTRKLSARKLSKQKRILKVHGSTPSEESLDLVVLGDGFSAKEMDISSDEALLASKFGEAVKKHVLGILYDEPWKSLKDHINIWVVATPSKDSGVSLPYKNVFKETTFSTALTCSGSPYVLEEGLALEAASEVPFDDVLMLVNSDSYGGAASNFLSAVNLSENAKDIILHELGHDRGFLADEYLRSLPEEENDRTPSSIESEGPLMLKLTDTREPYEEFINTLQSIWAWDTNHFSQGRMQINRNLASTGRCNPKHKQIVLHHDLQRNRPNTSKIDLDSEEPPMANLTISTDRHTGKWSKHLSEDAPTINFDYPTKALSWNKEKKLLKGVFKLQESREDLLILIGFLPKTNQLLTSQIKSVTINKDNEYLFSKESVPSGKFKGEIITTANQKEGLTFSFTSLPNVHLQEGASVEISIKFREDLSILLPERISQTTFLSLPSGVFKGQETGFFQGAHLSSKKVWRPNYCSKMNRSSSCPFFPVHIEKIKEMILHYLAPLQTQEDAS